MTTKRQLLKNLKGEKVTIYTVEKEITGVLRKFGNEYSISKITPNTTETVKILASDIVDFKRISAKPILFVHNHFNF